MEFFLIYLKNFLFRIRKNKSPHSLCFLTLIECEALRTRHSIRVKKHSEWKVYLASSISKKEYLQNGIILLNSFGL